MIAWLDSLRADAIFGWRQLNKHKTTSAAAILSLGLLAPDEYRTQMSLWAILAAPLLAGNDLSKMDATTKGILMNKEVIAVDQDRLGVQGKRVEPLQIWMISPRPLCNAKCQIRTRLPFILEMFTKLSSSVLTSPLYRTPPKTPSRQCNASGACGTVRALRTIPSGC